MSPRTARLLISCPDTRGIIAAVSGFVAEHRGNILDADQHTDPEHGEFFMRIEVDLDGFDLDRESFAPAWTSLAERFRMSWRIAWGDERKRMALLVSKAGHCLNDLLWRWKTGELPADVPHVIGNHNDLRENVAAFGVPFHHVPNTPEQRTAAEQQMLSLLSAAQVDLVVLARYMQVLSPRFLDQYTMRIINIHHSFLPAFAGPRPYHQAHERGVKLIGATSHYATHELDAGPIIAQQTTPVGHHDAVDDLVRKGRDLERVVLATAVRAHLEDKILISRNRTVVFM